jgi:hypothetical protein
MIYMKEKKLSLTITLSQTAYRRIGELAPTHKPSETIRNVLEAVNFFKGNYYDLVSLITNPPKKEENK